MYTLYSLTYLYTTAVDSRPGMVGAVGGLESSEGIY